MLYKGHEVSCLKDSHAGECSHQIEVCSSALGSSSIGREGSTITNAFCTSGCSPATRLCSKTLCCLLVLILLLLLLCLQTLQHLYETKAMTKDDAFALEMFINTQIEEAERAMCLLESSRVYGCFFQVKRRCQALS